MTATKFSSREISLEILHKALLAFDLYLPEAVEVEDGDCLEIFSTDGVQLIRDFSFYETCGYALDELYVYSFHELYDFDPSQHRRYAEAAQRVLLDARSLHFSPPLLLTLTEKMSSERLIVQTALKSICPLFASQDKKTVKALLTRSKRQIAGQAFDPPPTPPSPPPPQDPRNAAADFLKELLKALIFAAAYDLLKWFITQLHFLLQREERQIQIETRRKGFAADPEDFMKVC